MSRTHAAIAMGVALGWDKLTLTLAIIGATTYMAVEGLVDPAAPVALFTAILGYIFGASAPKLVEAAKESREE